MVPGGALIICRAWSLAGHSSDAVPAAGQLPALTQTDSCPWVHGPHPFLVPVITDCTLSSWTILVPLAYCTLHLRFAGTLQGFTSAASTSNGSS